MNMKFNFERRMLNRFVSTPIATHSIPCREENPMPIEEIKDNQWWYGQSELRPVVDGRPYIILSVGGLECPMVHAKRGNDGRTTYSFKFLQPSDQKLWQAANGQFCEIEVIQVLDHLPTLEIDPEDDSARDDTGRPLCTPFQLPGAPEPDHEMRTRFHRTDSNATLFDAYIFLDWSASNTPKQGSDSIWIGEAWFDNRGDLTWDTTNKGVCNPRARDLAIQHVEARLREHISHNRRVLLGFDFPYSYPNGTVELLIQGCAGPSWQTLWSNLANTIEDSPRNNSNRFDVANNLNQLANINGGGPFWGKPVGPIYDAFQHLPRFKPHVFSDPVPEFRIVEQALRDNGHHPHSVWQLYGNGSVGSQSLMGLPRLHHLRNSNEFHQFSIVWPFETGWTCPSQAANLRIVHVEFWPGAIPVDERLHDVRDAAQMLSTVDWAAGNDVAGTLLPYFDPLPPNDFRRDDAQGEGWILGFRIP